MTQPTTRRRRHAPSSGPETAVPVAPAAEPRAGEDVVETPPAPAPAPTRAWSALTDPDSRLPVYLGVALCAAGFVLLGIGWANVAGLADVWKQMPYLLSAGLPGIGLIMVGLVVINVAAKRQEATERRRQLGELTEAMRELRRALGRE